LSDLFKVEEDAGGLKSEVERDLFSPDLFSPVLL